MHFWISNNVEMQQPPNPADCINQFSSHFDHPGFQFVASV